MFTANPRLIGYCHAALYDHGFTPDHIDRRDGKTIWSNHLAACDYAKIMTNDDGTFTIVIF